MTSADSRFLRMGPPSSDGQGVETDRLYAALKSKLFGGETTTRIGRFVLRELLGEGGMGSVYRAHDPRLGRDVALKIGHRFATAASAGGVARREAEALARLSHENVVQVFEVASDAEPPYIAMELVEGPSLRRWLRQPRSIEEITRVYVQAARGLHAAHRAGLIHRDFKPDNVLLGADGRARVLDFGLVRGDEVDRTAPASRIETTEPDRRDTAIAGTWLYMAPEQHRGGSVTPAADQYAWCISLAEAFGGKHPLQGRTATDIVATKAAEVLDLRGVPRRLVPVLRRGLAALPDERFASMAELISAVEARTRPQNRRRIALALVACAGGGVWLSGSDGPSEHPGCIEARNLGEDAWNDGRREAITASFHRLILPYAASTWGRVEATLDRHQGAWTSALQSICGAEAVDEAKLACLADNARHVRSLAEVLEAVDATTLNHAWIAGTELPAPERCFHGGGDPPRRTATRALAQLVIEAQVLTDAGRFIEARARLEQRLPAIDGSADDSLRARAWQLFGRIERAMGEFDASREDQEHAFHIARRAGLDPMAVVCATNLARLELERTDFAAVDRWIGHAQALGGDDPIVVAELESIRAFVAHERGESARALAHGGTSLMLLAGRVPEDHPSVVGQLTENGRYLRELGRLDAAAESMRDAVARVERSRGSEHPDLAYPLSALGELELLRDPELARRLIERTVAIERTSAGQAARGTNNGLFDLGIVYAKRGELDIARSLFEAAATYYRRTFGDHHPLLGWSLYSLGNVEYMRRRFELALGHYREAQAILEAALGADHPRMAAVYNQVGQVASGQGDQDLAVRSFQRALELRRGDSNDPALARTLASLGWAEVRRRKFDTARPYLERSLAIYDETLGPDHMESSWNHIGLGIIDREQGRLERARASLERALRIRERSNARPVDIADARFELAQATGDRALAARALATYRGAGPDYADIVAIIERWMIELAPP